MCRIAATDQYYGALLSVMCNEGKVPVRLDREGERGAHRVYGLVGEDGRDRGHSLFAKYVRAADNMREGYDRWTFYFSEAEVDALMRLRERGGGSGRHSSAGRGRAARSRCSTATRSSTALA